MEQKEEKKMPLGQVKVEPSPKKETDQNLKIIAAIGYLWILCLVPLLGKKESEFAKHHGKQGLVLTICSFIIWLIAWIPVLGWFVGFFGTIALIVLAIMGIINALEGNYWEMPVLGEYAKKIEL